MKSSVEITMYVEISGDKIIGGYDENMGHGTMLSFGEQTQYDDRCGNLSVDIPDEGEKVIFSIPSGDFEGVVHRISPLGECDNKKHAYDPHEKYSRINMSGIWIGKFYGLTGGKSCYGKFYCEIDNYEPVESSWGTMEFREYQLIRKLRDNAEIAESAIQTYSRIMKVDNYDSHLTQSMTEIADE